MNKNQAITETVKILSSQEGRAKNQDYISEKVEDIAERSKVSKALLLRARSCAYRAL